MNTSRGMSCLDCESPECSEQIEGLERGDLVMDDCFRYALVLDSGLRLIQRGDGHQERLSQRQWHQLIPAPGVAGKGGKSNFASLLRDLGDAEKGEPKEAIVEAAGEKDTVGPICEEENEEGAVLIKHGDQ